MSLPGRHGGLGLPVPTGNANIHFRACASVTAPLIDLICHRHHDYPTHVRLEQRQRKVAIHSNKRSETLTKANSLKSTLPTPKQKGMEQASEKGTSSWLVTTSLAKYSFNLHKQAFQDTLCLRYGWTPVRLTSHTALVDISLL